MNVVAVLSSQGRLISKLALILPPFKKACFFINGIFYAFSQDRVRNSGIERGAMLRRVSWFAQNPPYGGLVSHRFPMKDDQT